VLACFLVAYVLFAIKRMKLVDMYAYDNEWNLLIAVPLGAAAFLYLFFCRRQLLFISPSYCAKQGYNGICVALLGLTAWWGSGLNLALPLAGTYLLFYIAYHPRIRYHNFA
jgi:hypothetical protein